MSTTDPDKKSYECDDPCDDCSSAEALTGWITSPAVHKLHEKTLDTPDKT
jgi:hypothetical protein|tara:strand:+ start:1870 stop:2019 length:150 start_codon:yes stop_codon:yes gene_type:complete